MIDLLCEGADSLEQRWDMSFDKKSRSLIESILQNFESDYRQEWEEERFTILPHPCQTNLGKLDFDTIFFWKVYAQGYSRMYKK